MIVAGDVNAAAHRAAGIVAATCTAAIRERGRAVIACSGGHTPRPLFERLRDCVLPWSAIFVAQVDERMAPSGDPRRNLLRLQEVFVEHGALPASNLLPMPVHESNIDAATRHYQASLEKTAGRPLRFDVVHLGLGADGHTASLLPADPVLAMRDRDVATSGPYQGLRRMTLTLPALDRARSLLWFVAGSDKQHALEELVLGTGHSPAVLVARTASTVVTETSSVTPALARWLREHRVVAAAPTAPPDTHS